MATSKKPKVPTAKVWDELRAAFKAGIAEREHREDALDITDKFAAEHNYVIHEMADGGDWGFVTLGEECVHEGHMDSVINYVTEQLGIPWRRILGMGDRGWRSPKTNTAELMSKEEQ
jgi:hypothetical protein